MQLSGDDFRVKDPKIACFLGHNLSKKYVFLKSWYVYRKNITIYIPRPQMTNILEDMTDP